MLVVLTKPLVKLLMNNSILATCLYYALQCSTVRCTCNGLFKMSSSHSSNRNDTSSDPCVLSLTQLLTTAVGWISLERDVSQVYKLDCIKFQSQIHCLDNPLHNKNYCFYGGYCMQLNQIWVPFKIFFMYMIFWLQSKLLEGCNIQTTWGWADMWPACRVRAQIIIGAFMFWLPASLWPDHE